MSRVGLVRASSSDRDASESLIFLDKCRRDKQQSVCTCRMLAAHKVCVKIYYLFTVCINCFISFIGISIELCLLEELLLDIVDARVKSTVDGAIH